jgi:putative resolvase
MRLVDWAKLQGVHDLTAYRWWRDGQLPVPARQMPSGAILVDLAPER